jgi:hypothetical protein
MLKSTDHAGEKDIWLLSRRQFFLFVMCVPLIENPIFVPMNFFRKSYLKNLLILMAGITFLNMGFLLAEVSLLDLGKYYAAADEVSTSLEDEQENTNESQTNDSEEEIDLMNHFYREQSFNIFFISLRKEAPYIQEILHQTFPETFSPPPELSPSMA